ncbi:MFS DHA1 transporter [Pholiota conissans]|uniref:MFS DHA1 transporter n=1 Tax=Pholiota conissans TaxID=109636 RepID=A0A9P5YSZ2_9AGAR|nr:MFS DHA1 transporter [Pholiota conissans]
MESNTRQSGSPFSQPSEINEAKLKTEGSDLSSACIIDAVEKEDIVATELFIFRVPVRLRYSKDRPFQFSYSLIIIYAISTAILVANLYYCQPLLIAMSESFGVSYERVSRIPTFVQVGYAIGLLIICPLGDIVRRRQLIIFLTLVTTLLSIGLAVTANIVVFEAITFVMGFTNVSAQILSPLVAEIAPLERRAFAYSIVLAGLMFGILFARVLAGIIGEFVVWRIVYYVAVGLQTIVLLVLYFTLPDYPSPNRGLPYWKIHWSMAKLAVMEPVVVQAVLINLGTSACFAYFWVTLTFLLGGPPYNYSTLDIGLFGLLGMAGVAAGPISGRIVDRMHPWHAILISTLLLLMFQSIQTAAGGLHISAVIISCFGLDFLQQIQSIGLVMSFFSVSQSAISRLNAIYILSFYVGQMIGTAAGTRIFVQYGWRAAGVFAMSLYGLQLAALAVRGPHCKQHTWFGYSGGFNFRRDDPVSVDSETSGSTDSEEKI